MLLTRSIHHCANVSFTDPAWWYDFLVVARAKGLTQGKKPASGKGPAEQAVDPDLDPMVKLAQKVQREVEAGKAILPADFFDRFAVFDSRRHKVIQEIKEEQMH